MSRKTLLGKLNRAYLDSGKIQTQPPPPPTQSSEAEVVSAPCPVMYEMTGQGYCGDIRCGTCELLALWLDKWEVNATSWLCSKCCDDEEVRVLPYWSEGECEECGFPSSVLLLTELL